MNLYTLARRTQDAKALASGDPERIVRRARHKVIGRLLRPLWKVVWK